MDRANSVGIGHPGSERARRGTWVVIAITVAVIVAIGSVLSAATVARTATQRSEDGLSATANSISGALAVTLQHEQDLVVAATAFFAADPYATQAQFLQWVHSVSAFARYPELVGIAEIALVTPSQLPAYAARTATDVTVTPPGIRPFYCLRGDWAAAHNGSPIPAGFDLCQTPEGAALLAIRDAGTSADLPYGSGAGEGLGLARAVYLGGGVPATVATRRQAIVGWVGEQINAQTILHTALEGHSGTAVSIHYGSGASAVTFTSGRAPAGASMVSTRLQGGWTVRVSGPVTTNSIFGNGSALFRLMAGLLVGVLLAALIYVLGTSRSRALEMVRDRTEQLRQLALHDPLTGLPNRTLILDRLDQMMARARREDSQVAVLFLDLDNFKDINDSFGHPGGDQLLTGVAARLVEALRGDDSVGRLGGDEFVVLAGGTSLDGGAATVAERILEALTPPFAIEGSDYPVTVSVSIGMAEGLRPEPEQLLLDADIALYQAKNEGKRRAVLFSASMAEEREERQHLERDLHQALAAGQFFVDFPPTIAVSDGAPAGVEARLGWNHPTRGVVDPERFTPLLESSGLIVPVGRWLLEEACRYGAGLGVLGEGDGPMMVSVPVSAVQFRQERFVDLVNDALSDSGCEPGRLVVVLTEAALKLGHQRAMTRLRELKALGVKIGLGEFDTGYSTFTYLQSFPIDVLQIDRSLARDTSDQAEAAAIVETLGQIGKAFGVDIVAEHLEVAAGTAGPVGAGR